MAALILREPHAIEAGPLPGSSRGNGGRCFTHSENPSYLLLSRLRFLSEPLTWPRLPELRRSPELDISSVDEPA